MMAQLADHPINVGTYPVIVMVMIVDVCHDDGYPLILQEQECLLKIVAFALIFEEATGVGRMLTNKTK